MSGFSLTLTGRHFHSIFFLTKVRRWPLPMIWWVSLDFLQYTLQKAPLCFAWFITTGPVGQIPSHWEIYWITCQATAGLPRSDLSSGFRGAFPVLADAASFWEKQLFIFPHNYKVLEQGKTIWRLSSPTWLLRRKICTNVGLLHNSVFFLL